HHVNDTVHRLCCSEISVLGLFVCLFCSVFVFCGFFLHLVGGWGGGLFMSAVHLISTSSWATHPIPCLVKSHISVCVCVCLCVCVCVCVCVCLYIYIAVFIV